MKHRLSISALALIFVTAGVLHFLRPDPYVSIVPHWLPRRVLVYLSGIFQILGGVGLLLPRFRRAAAAGLILLLLAVWPANFQMLLNARASNAPPGWQALMWIRLPLQPLLMWWIWRAAKLKPGSARDAVGLRR